MELELALGLPSMSAPSKGLGFDLNGDACATPVAVHNKQKRGFTDAFGSDDAITTLPLFHWASIYDNHTNDDYNNCDGGCTAKAEYDGGCGGMIPVGWPPVRSVWRNSGGGVRYVKVKMEGVAIGRKVDLSLHRSYASLQDALDRLFFTNQEEGGQVGDSPRVPPPASGRHRAFTYQVGSSDWMLLGDVPWETFVKSVKRVKILSCSQ